MKLEVKRPDKELWQGVTKADLAKHMATVAGRMLPHLRGRPLTLVRAPNGIEAHSFYQKDVGHLPGGLSTCSFDDVDYVLADRGEDLVALADQAVVELHGWTSRCDDPEVPDRIVFDLDPPDMDAFAKVQAAARDLCQLLQSRGATPFPLLTGSKGIHIVVPLKREADYAEVAAFAGAVADVMVRHDPALTTYFRKEKRKGRIFVDILRNRPRQTSVVPWSPRARPGAPVAVPIGVDDLDDPELHPQQARIGDIDAALAHDPWRGYFDAAVPLSALT